MSAALLFSIQPMFAKVVLPMLGGTPAVWNTCMVFYQSTLLAGYLYAHVSIKLLGLKRQMALHIGLIVLAILVLPTAPSEAMTSPLTSSPITGLFIVLIGAIGLPLFFISATAPMLQKWFSHTGHPSARDPYFLYAASNTGSIVALLSYPVLIEPQLALKEQIYSWSAGYVVLTVLIVACALSLMKFGTGKVNTIGGNELSDREEPQPSVESACPTLALRAKWIALSFVPASLLLGVTSYITADIAAVPLLWVIPLLLYLLTFVIAFARRPILGHLKMVRAEAVLVLPLVISLAMSPLFVMEGSFFVHLIAFTAMAMVCHGELVRSRPPLKYLTEFYIWISVGGMLGGIFNAIIAPALFDSLIEYPLAVVLACMLRPNLDSDGRKATITRNDIALPLLLLALLAGLLLGIQHIKLNNIVLVKMAIASFAGVFCLSLSKQPVRFGLGICAILLAGMISVSGSSVVVYAKRSFWGVYRIASQVEGQYNALYHGTTLHGAQYTSPDMRHEPLTYYHKDSPIGQVLLSPLGDKSDRRVAIVGLGVGTLASYGRSGERWTFYEIDPLVARIARDDKYFSFIRDSQTEVDVVLGDARISLSNSPSEVQYDLIVIDAFTSDAIPIHLITREALGLYLSRLSEGGIIAFHISNRHLDLKPVLGNLSSDASLASLFRLDGSSASAIENFKRRSMWVVLARDSADLSAVSDDQRWKSLPVNPDERVWTDDYSNILGILNIDLSRNSIFAALSGRSI